MHQVGVDALVAGTLRSGVRPEVVAASSSALA